MLTVRVTKDDIRRGVAGDCDACAVALAASRATDEECGVQTIDWELHLRVNCFYIQVPFHVAAFVRQFDDWPRCPDDTLKLLPQLPLGLQPFSFEIPDLTSDEWRELCWKCGDLFDQSELDEEGCCEACTS